MDRNLRSILASVLITAFIVGGGVYWWQSTLWTNEVDRLNNEIVELRQQVEEGQAVDPQDGDEDAEEPEPEPEEPPTEVTEISQKPKAGWEEYFPSFDETTLEGRTTEEIRTLLGEPPVLVRNVAVNPEFTREIWVFRPYDEDPTGLYLYFKTGKLMNSRLDEFSGLEGLLGDSDFWYN